jgi:hypothetical protein
MKICARIDDRIARCRRSDNNSLQALNVTLFVNDYISSRSPFKSLDGLMSSTDVKN